MEPLRVKQLLRRQIRVDDSDVERSLKQPLFAERERYGHLMRARLHALSGRRLDPQSACLLLAHGHGGAFVQERDERIGIKSRRLFYVIVVARRREHRHEHRHLFDRTHGELYVRVN